MIGTTTVVRDSTICSNNGSSQRTLNSQWASTKNRTSPVAISAPAIRAFGIPDLREKQMKYLYKLWLSTQTRWQIFVKKSVVLYLKREKTFVVVNKPSNEFILAKYQF
jgi:hypothetical protein